jgi:hypothetical protein
MLLIEDQKVADPYWCMTAPRPRRPVILLAAGAALLGVCLTACTGSRFRYIRHESTRTYFKVPEAWRLFNEDEILKAQASQLTAAERASVKQTQWYVAFDGAHAPQLAHVLDFDVHEGQPSGLAKVRVLTTDERSSLTPATLRGELFQDDPVHAASLGNGTLDILENTEVTRAGGLHGIHLLMKVHRTGGRVFTFNQIALTDKKVHALYLLALGCESSCYEANKRTINEVISSWTIKDH